MWCRRKHRPEPIRPEGQPLCDGDVYPFPGQRERLAQLVTREYPIIRPGTDTTRLVRPYLNSPGIEEIRQGEYWSAES